MNEERTGSSNNNCNVSVVICGTDIPLRLTNKGNNKITEHRAIFQRERKTHKSTNRQSQSQPENWENLNGPDLVHAFPKKWWVESDFTAPNLLLPLRLKGFGCHYNSIFNNTGTN